MVYSCRLTRWTKTKDKPIESVIRTFVQGKDLTFSDVYSILAAEFPGWVFQIKVESC